MNNSKNLKESVLSSMTRSVERKLRYAVKDGVAEKMALAISIIIDELRTNSSARIGSGWMRSRNNISYLLSNHVLPVLNQIQLDSNNKFDDFNVGELVFESLNPRSIGQDIKSIIDTIHILIPNVLNEDRVALDLAEQFFVILVTHYLPKSIHIDSTINNFCIFCYREARPSFDSCEDHAGSGRTDGQRSQARFLELLRGLMRIRDNEGRTNQFVLLKLKECNLTQWNGDIHDEEWIKKLVKTIRICTEDKDSIDRVAKEIMKNSVVFSDLFYHSDWPSGLNATLARYQAYKCVGYRRPTEVVANKLNQLFSSELSVDELSKKIGVTPFSLYRIVAKWTKNIQIMRKDGLSDSVIKMALGLLFLPD